MEKGKVLLADDQLLIKEAWRILFDKQDAFVIAGETSTTDETIMQVEQLKPDIVMFEIMMPGTDGLETIKNIVQEYALVKILVLSAIKDTATVIAALQNGASGYVTKDASSEEVFRALNLVHKGHKYVCDELNEALIEEIIHPTIQGKAAIDRWGKLTPTEKKVVGFLQEGIGSRQIAQELNLSARTIEVHRYHILKKMNQPNTVALVTFLNRNKIIPK